MDFKSIWKSGKNTPPKIGFGVSTDSGEQFIVLEDDSTVIRLMNKKGQIFVVAAFRCQQQTSADGRKYYSCDSPIHPVTCSKLVNDRDIFALKKLKPVFFG